MHLRIRQGGDILLGRLGAGPAVASWLLLGAGAVAAFLLGSVFLLLGLGLAVLVIVLLSRAGKHTHWSHFALVASMITGAITASFVWWVMGLQIDAADTFAPTPPEAVWLGPALVMFLISGISFLLSAVFAILNQSRSPRR